MARLARRLGNMPAVATSFRWTPVSGVDRCPAFSGDLGYDYSTNLYIAIPSANWSAGRYNPGIGEADCIDLVVTKFTGTEVDITFGSFYSQQYPKFALTPGTAYQVAVNGLSYGGTVSYS